uniref:U75-Liphistoxin-Lsp1a_1 n=1 Tax=Liphistius sp. SGP-2016 TaxID=1905180 RepID=A0A4Q8K763_9ARAC
MKLIFGILLLCFLTTTFGSVSTFDFKGATYRGCNFVFCRNSCMNRGWGGGYCYGVFYQNCQCM